MPVPLFSYEEVMKYFQHSTILMVKGSKTQSDKLRQDRERRNYGIILIKVWEWGRLCFRELTYVLTENIFSILYSDQFPLLISF